MALQVQPYKPPTNKLRVSTPKPKTAKLTVKPIKKQPKVVVKPLKPQPTLKVSTNGSGTTYNPQQQSPTQLQGSKTQLQSTYKAPAKPALQSRSWTETTLKADGTTLKVTKTEGMTDDQWRIQNKLNKESALVRAELERLQKSWGSALTSRDKYEQARTMKIDALVARFDSDFKIRDDYLGALAQQRNNAKTQEEWDRLTKLGVQMEADLSGWVEDQYIKYEAYNTEYQKFMDGKLTDQRSLLNRAYDVPGEVSSGIFKYTLGSGDKNVPSMISAFTRVPNFIANQFDRTIESQGEQVRTGQMSVDEKWQATHGQPVVMTSVKDDDLSGFWERAYVYANPLSVNEGIREQLKRQLSGDSYTDREAKRKGTFDPTSKPTIQRFTETVVADIIFDPSTYIGAGAMSKLRNATKATSTYKGATKAVSTAKKSLGNTTAGRAVKWLGQDVNKSQTLVGKAVGKVNKKLTGKLKNKTTDLYDERVGMRRSEYRVLMDAQKKAWDDVMASVKANHKITTGTDFSGEHIRILERIDDIDPKVVDYAQRLRLGKGYNKMSNGKIQFIKKDMFPDMTPQQIMAYKRGLNRAQKAEADDLARALGKLADATMRADDAAFTDDALRRIRQSGTGRRYIPTDPLGDNSASWVKKRRHTVNTKKGFVGTIQTPKQLQGSVFHRLNTTMRRNPGNSYVIHSDIKISYKDIAAMAEQSETWAKAIGKSDDIKRGIAGIEKQILKVQKQIGRRNIGKANPVMWWRKSVLGYRPAWYVNNEVYNQLASITASGTGGLKGQRGWKKYLDDLGEKASDLVSGVGDDVGAGFTGRLASAQENRTRVGLYRFFVNKGLTHDEAVAGVNRWLFDYTVRNVDRPFRTVMPFWKWQQSLSKRLITMTAETPRGAKAFSTIDKEFSQRPLENLPEGDIVIVDPATGEKTKYNPRKSLGGKLKIPFTNKWVNAPWNAFSTSGNDSVGLNPFITAFKEIVNNRDNWGNKLNDVNWQESILRQIPQYKLVKGLRESGGLGGSRLDLVEKWLAKGSGFSKEAQGVNPSLSNYRPELDPTSNLGKQWLSFFGISKPVDFDEPKFKEDLRYNGFNRDWFRQDWAEKAKTEGWDSVLAQQDAMARNYGFDLQEDIYNDRWTRYDSNFTKLVKAQKEMARNESKKFWAKYTEIRNGDGGYQNARAYIELKKDDWQRTNAFVENPQLRDILQDWFFSDVGGNPTQPTFDTGYTPKPLKTKQTSAKAKFWQGYFALAEEQRLDYYRTNHDPAYGGASLNKQDQKELAFWKEFYELPPDRRSILLKENPEYNKFAAPEPKTTAEWDAYRDANRKKKYAKFEGDAEFEKLKKANYDKINPVATQYRLTKSAKKRRVIWKT